MKRDHNPGGPPHQAPRLTYIAVDAVHKLVLKWQLDHGLYLKSMDFTPLPPSMDTTV